MTATLTPMPSPASTEALGPRRWRWPVLTLLVAGLALVGGAVLWRSVAVPALVKFPTDVDHRLSYDGTFVQYVDAATAAPLVEARVAPLTIERHIQALPGESDAHIVVARETIVIGVAGLPPSTQVHEYAMDRSTNANVADRRPWGFDETNVLDRSGSYRLALARDLDEVTTARMYSDDIGATYQARVGPGTEVVGGLELVAVEATVTATPLTDAYMRTLDDVTPLPRALTFDQLKPSLLTAGIAVDEALAALLVVATPDELATLAGLVAAPIPLQYVTSFTGRTLVEPVTGAIVDVRSVVQRVSARPSGDAVATLRAILAAHRADPVIAAAIRGLDALVAAPLPVFEFRYGETPASVDDMASLVSGQRGRIALAERTVPLALAIAGVLALAGGGGLLVLCRRARRTDAP